MAVNHSAIYPELLVGGDFKGGLHLIDLSENQDYRLPIQHDVPYPMVVVDDLLVCNYPNKTIVTWSLEEILSRLASR